MKRIFLAFLLLSIPLCPVGWTGMTCSKPQQRITYNSLYSVGAAVNSAYAAYMDQVVTGKAVFNSNVAKAYTDFQSGFAVAVQMAQLNTFTVAPQQLCHK